MSFGDTWARNWRNGRLIGGLLMMPLVYGLITFAMCTLTERQTVVLTAPRHISVLLDGDAIPKKSAINYSKEGQGDRPLEYRFDIDEGEYTLRVTVDDTTDTLEQPMVIDAARRTEILVTVIDDEDGLHIDLAP